MKQLVASDLYNQRSKIDGEAWPSHNRTPPSLPQSYHLLRSDRVARITVSALPTISPDQTTKIHDSNHRTRRRRVEEKWKISSDLLQAVVVGGDQLRSRLLPWLISTRAGTSDGDGEGSCERDQLREFLMRDGEPHIDEFGAGTRSEVAI
ncbi:hypothetical protein TIFTF001_007787 [Ficus carica]|uniref:Uncharacterized protein n=1 Tax=Ficus carica TaxID=3494 RepID=A0AA87ZK70_FICCA|nr:hypothetical protein TIFTF001_007787 [Ficus carica]